MFPDNKDGVQVGMRLNNSAPGYISPEFDTSLKNNFAQVLKRFSHY